MRVKICGLMRPKDIEVAADYGADAVGFVVGTPISRRNLKMDEAKKLIKHAPVFISSVAVTATSDPKVLQKIVTKLHPDALQVHGCDLRIMDNIRKTNPGLAIILATPIRDAESISEAEMTVKYSEAVLAESPNQFGTGGTGRTHNWKLTVQLRNRIYPHPLILAGGLTPNNVRTAINEVGPYGVDVSSGVERTIGVKDYRKMKEFIKRAKETEA